jgi:parvulin-like peptidyl-prolyl isomerase
LAKNRKEEKPREYTKRQLSHHKKQERRQKIILISGITVIVAVILLITGGWLFGEYLPLNKTIVTVYDTKIKQSMLIDTMIYFSQGNSGVDLASQMDSILNYMIQNELNKQAAAAMGITVSDDEIETAYGKNLDEAQKAGAYGSLLNTKLKDEYFNTQVPDSGNQVLMNAMLVESEELIPQLRQELLSSGNFSALAEKYAVNTVSKDNKGVFDWHPASVLTTNIGTSIPVDWAFNENVSVGDISSGVSDNSSSKQLGYWLIRVNETPAAITESENTSVVVDTSANISALLVSSKAEALRVKALLEANNDISAIADTYSQYSPSQQGHGELGIVAESENISAPFNNYAFNANTIVGAWSDPIQDTQFWTKGGAWFIQLVDRSNNRAYSKDDKDTLITKAYSDWTNALWTGAADKIIYNFNEEERALALQRATEKITG